MPPKCISAKGQAVGFVDGYFQRVEAADGGHGAKGLVVEDFGIEWHVDEF